MLDKEKEDDDDSDDADDENKLVDYSKSLSI